MPLQKQPCRKVNLYSRPAHVPFEEFRQTLVDLTRALRKVPIAKQNLLRVDLAFSETDWSKLAQSLSLAPNVGSTFEAIMIVEVESLEKYEEMGTNAEFIRLKEQAGYATAFERVEYIFFEESEEIVM
ncbi:hypothetical protein C8R46DRAFT_1233697 [Mycena filopes]|nr:hypothetical protein C8R46DRAFT_1233697 [Mycena filopes]